MNLILEMKAGPSPGKKLVIAEGQKSVVGRAPTAAFSFPEDKFLSSNHCALEAAAQGCRVTDLNSSNGTFLNGSRIREALLKEGDELVVGHLTFVVHLAANLETASRSLQELAATPAPGVSPSSPVQIGNWSFLNVPAGWELIEGHGIRDANKGAFPSSVIVGKDVLQPQMTLAQYIQAQVTIIRTHIPQARAKDVAPTSFPSAEEAASLELEIPAPDGRQGIQRQLYARFGSTVGVVTLTALASDLPRLEPVFNSIRAGLGFRPE
jgi:pSer/pThr/pTyr-binding forkhead associated (FHA) protein